MSKAVFVPTLDPLELDVVVFSYWLNGCASSVAARSRMHQEPSVTPLFDDDVSLLLLSETEEMYQLFNMIEIYLQNPPTFFNQMVFQIPLAVRHSLIDLYYTFDDPVVRELLGRKLNGKDRKDLDDVSEKNNLSIKSCRRQFDNIKRVLKVVDDSEGSLVDNVKRRFFMKDSLAQSYALLVFICHNRFETGKKKLAHLSISDFTSCAKFMIEKWTSRSGESRHLVDDDLELDRDFLHEIHDLKLNLVDRVWIDHHQKYVIRDLKRKHCPPWLLRSIETNFKMFSRNLTTMGASLIHSKDLKDFFVDIIEKLIDPALSLKWSREDMDVLFTSVIETFSDCETSHVGQLGRFTNKDRTRWADTYLRYLEVMKHCAITLYHS